MKNLLNLLKLFKDRPNHLYKYLMENSAFSPEFLEKVNKSSLLSDKSITENKNFNNIKDMNEFYDSLLLEKIDGDNIEGLFKRLKELIELEKYEEAARVRDYLIKKGKKI